MQTLTVGELTGYLKALLESDLLLSAVEVRGEVTDCRVATSGHLYFSLKDARALLKCVVWRSSASRLGFVPTNGQQVVARGRISVFEAGGGYQLTVSDLRRDGVGDLYQAFLRLKERLTAEGLFDDQRKRPIAFLPRRLGLVTSGSGAALHDMLTTLRARHPGVDVVVSHALVQGVEAPASLIVALRRLWRLSEAGMPIDTIIIARGGGSFEDLNAFNDEGLVRAVAQSPIPVISGVGHETDTTLCDFAADLRAATPTAAADRAVPVRAELVARQRELEERLEAAVDGSLQRVHARLVRQHPVRRIESARQLLDLATDRLQARIQALLERRRSRLVEQVARLDALSPLRVLTRGYAVCRTSQHEVVRRVTQCAVGEVIEVLLPDGTLDATVSAAHPRS